MNNDIYEIMKGDRDERLVREQSYIEYMFPVVNREGYIDDVAVIAVSLESMKNERGYFVIPCQYLDLYFYGDRGADSIFHFLYGGS